MPFIEPIWIVLILSIITLLYNIYRNWILDKRNPDFLKIKYLSNIKLNEKTIDGIRYNKKEDILQDLIDEIILSYNSEKLNLYKKLIKILDNKWNKIINKKISEMGIVSGYFCEHYRNLIDYLIKNKGNYDSIYPLLLSFYEKTTEILNLKEVTSGNIYQEEALFYSNIFSDFIIKSIEESNDAIFRVSIEFLIEQLKLSVKFSIADLNINILYINNLKRITEFMCTKVYDDFDYFSVKLMHVATILSSHKLYYSLNNLLDIFDFLIDFELESFKGIDDGKTRVNKLYRLIITERSLMYIWCNFQLEIPQKCSDKIIEILKKIHTKKPYISSSLLTAYSKTNELLKKDDLKRNVEKLQKKVEE